ncbi:MULTISPECIES: hypothetical protein [Rhodococcus]|uniref:hypothetical protein n=1 Tax=Rhodococcus TaxID=1827 RepID=UPI00295476CF|nr:MULTISPECIES: hypothetical protein [Rhodococcus]MDV7243296.1 hypothetical protein [Rhodococcus oxybenzonivorans]MDV7276724.1 hypothetical protein [Rhodococcus oxybenzonivorans]MDV7334445.1 hypothetical protein [Rhodococcus oxybenzonivorans]MDV7344600.1 hypothetical protein [Rhodococcus oxybenzonivorans]MDV8030469.1 hypothetical protein [Rhodococcus sp. IEGM 27]
MSIAGRWVSAGCGARLVHRRAAHKDLPAEIVDYLRGHGRHKVLFGSNHPAWPAPDCLAGLDKLELDENARAVFLRENAIRAFDFPA